MKDSAVGSLKDKVIQPDHPGWFDYSIIGMSGAPGNPTLKITLHQPAGSGAHRGR